MTVGICHVSMIKNVLFLIPTVNKLVIFYYKQFYKNNSFISNRIQITQKNNK